MLARARRGGADLRSMTAFEAFPSKPLLIYPSSRYRHAILSLPTNPGLSVTPFAEAVTSSTDKTTLFLLNLLTGR